MFEDASGRLAHSIEEAKTYLWTFIGENVGCEDANIRQRSGDFDLYLPWLLEILEYQKAGDRAMALPVLELQVLYMDAAWSLATEGYLRPGPRTISGDPTRDGYGKGYSLTPKGRSRLQSGA